ncbi:MAG: NUDIX hydrolase [Flavisolibacter sp.]
MLNRSHYSFLFFVLSFDMMIKIFFDNKPLFLVDAIDKHLEEYLHHDDTVLIDEFNIHTIKAMIHEMELPRIHAGVFLHTDPNAVLKAFKKKLVLVLAAGGFVHTPQKEILLIFRRGKWDLPKGKLDPGESLEQCAIRELSEETGIQALSEGPLCTTYHTYHEFGRHVLKESHWFLMKVSEKTEFVPQQEEDIEKCIWVPYQELDQYKHNTHASLLDVIQAGLKSILEPVRIESAIKKSTDKNLSK